MVIDIVSLIAENPALCLFLVIGLGYLLGNAPLGRVTLGPMAGVLLAGMVFGHFGFHVPDYVQELGFILFIYSVGLQAGPRFFSIFFSDGFKYAALALVTALAAVGTTLACTRFIAVEPGLSAGMLAGALTSSPHARRGPGRDAQRPDIAGRRADRGPDHERRERGPTPSPIFSGCWGLLGGVRLMPRLMRLDIKADARKLAKERRIKDDDETAAEGKPMMRAFEVSNPEVIGKPLKELHFGLRTGCVIQHVKRGGELFAPDSDTTLAAGDHISIVGPGEALDGMDDRIGPGVFDLELLKPPVESTVVIVTHPDTVGKAVSELHTLARHGCFITRITRAQIELPVSMDVVLEKGDAVQVAGLKERLDELVKTMGYVERRVIQTDLLTFALGIVFGLLLGKVTVKVGAVAMGMGAAGGLLLSGILIGFLRSIHPTFGRVPPPARWVIMELGLIFFMAGVGINAGESALPVLKTVGLPLFFSGVAVTLAAMIVGAAFGLFVLRLPPSLLMGALAGAMTSTPALSAVDARGGQPGPDPGLCRGLSLCQYLPGHGRHLSHVFVIGERTGKCAMNSVLPRGAGNGARLILSSSAKKTRSERGAASCEAKGETKLPFDPAEQGHHYRLVAGRGCGS